MAKTFTEQVPVPSGNIDADGDGMHSLIPFDLVRGLNNLGTYTNPHLHYVQGASFDPSTGATGKVAVSYTGGTREGFALEVPLLVPWWAFRMVWTVGARCISSTMSALTVYLSRTPYTGPDGNDGPFNATGMATGYRSRSVNMASLTGGAYELADDHSTGITPIDQLVAQDLDLNGESKVKRLSYAIVTATCGTNASFEIDDCSFWFLPS